MDSWSLGHTWQVRHCLPSQARICDLSGRMSSGEQAPLVAQAPLVNWAAGSKYLTESKAVDVVEKQHLCVQDEESTPAIPACSSFFLQASLNDLGVHVHLFHCNQNLSRSLKPLRGLLVFP